MIGTVERVHRAASQQLNEKCALNSEQWSRERVGDCWRRGKAKASAAADSPAVGSLLDRVSGLP